MPYHSSTSCAPVDPLLVQSGPLGMIVLIISYESRKVMEHCCVVQ